MKIPRIKLRRPTFEEIFILAIFLLIATNITLCAMLAYFIHTILS